MTMLVDGIKVHEFTGTAKIPVGYEWKVEYETHHVHAGRIFVKSLVLEKAGDACLQHAHVYEHATLVAAGRARVMCGDVYSDYGPGSIVKIVKDIAHQIVALEPMTLIYCIHVTED